MEINQIEIAIRLLVLTSLFLLPYTECSNSTTGRVYKNINDVKRIGSPFQRMMLNDSLYCIINCENLVNCQSFNLISNSNGSDRFLCELFNETSDCSRMQIIENATYFEVFPTNDCVAIAQGSYQDDKDSVYDLRLTSDREIEAFCDMNTDHGGWTLLQRRVDGSVDFFRDWQSYKQGFGNLSGEFWLGLDNAHELMKDTNTTLRFDLWDGDEHRYAEYYEAMIASESDYYRLTFKGYKGDAGNSMVKHNNQRFSTKDKDNDKRPNANCASNFFGAWWYNWCHDANLNGKYGSNAYAKGINWHTITAHYYSLSKTEIKIRRNEHNIC